MASATLAYFAIRLEIVKPMLAQMPWPSPVGIGAFVGSGGDWKAAVLAVFVQSSHSLSGSHLLNFMIVNY